MVDVQYGKAAQEGDYVIVVHNRYNSSAVTGVGKVVGNKIRTSMADLRSCKRVWVNKMSGLYVISENAVPERDKRFIENNINNVYPYSENSIWI